jgi:GNAT superfamily N-acetyltransferase
MSNTALVRKVDNPADFKAFFEFPWTLYKGDPHWTPPLLSMRRDLLDQKKNPSWEYLEGDYFAAWRGEKIVGTIAAYINHRHNEFHQENIGWFGAFEVYDDQEAAAALLNTAADWVKAKGCEMIRGPQTFTVHEDVGLLVDGFTRPVLLMPYNPPYYQRLIENTGFSKHVDSFSFYFDEGMVAEKAALDRLRRVTEAVMRRQKVTIRQVDSKNLQKEFELFKDLYNQAWEKNYGFVPMTPKELDALVESLGQFFEPRLAFFGYVEDQPAGFLMVIPDFNQVLLKAYAKPGTPEIFTLLKAVWHWKIRPCIDWVRVPLMGVKEEYRSRGVDVAMYFHGLDALLKLGYKYGDTGWILETNQAMVSIANNFGERIYKTHRLYQKSLV